MNYCTSLIMIRTKCAANMIKIKKRTKLVRVDSSKLMLRLEISNMVINDRQKVNCVTWYEKPGGVSKTHLENM